MKKSLFFFSAVLVLSGCSSNNDEIVVNPDGPVKLVDASLEVSMGEQTTTRSYLGQAHEDPQNHNTYVEHFFESTDKFLVCDYVGKYIFNVRKGQGQTTSIEGYWAEVQDEAVLNGITVVVPASAAKEKPVTVADECPTMHMTLPTTQETRYREYLEGGGEITYDQSAGLSFACNTKAASNLTFFPLVTFLYFYSSYEYCVVSGTGIAGDIDATYTAKKETGSNYYGDKLMTCEGISEFINYSANANSILCKGKKLESHNNNFGDLGGQYEYVVCIRPGAYAANDLKVYSNTQTVPTDASATAFHNKVDVNLYNGFLYWFGKIDPQ